ncbi:type IV secretory system conjugative DNA transfer family protein [Hoeflea sp. AS60]|uniref:type IV secretory system conjugative DNA transfer family protein n=1 Tax=Hoeflea sp. AS60 TaxID=3135780 RepID=UPI00316F9336
MSFRPIYEGWNLPGRLSQKIRTGFAGIGLNRDLKAAMDLAASIEARLIAKSLTTDTGRIEFAFHVSRTAMMNFGVDEPDHRFTRHITEFMADLISYEGWFALPALGSLSELTRSELWELEDHLKRVETIIDNLQPVGELAVRMLTVLVTPIVEQLPHLLHDTGPNNVDISFSSDLRLLISDAPALVEHMMHIPFAPDLESLRLTPRLRERLEYNLHIASGGAPGDADSVRSPKLPTRQSAIPDEKIAGVYLDGTPLLDLLDYRLDITLPQETRFEHTHIVAGSGHGKTQTLQHLILHDLDTVARSEASIIVIDSQSDLINTIAGLDIFAPGAALDGRLVLIDPTDIEWPVALNLFDAGLDRLEQYSPLDRERLTNSILELYDFVLGTLLDAGMTQKQNVIFRYITRLLLHIPGATIHTLRELLEDGGYDNYRQHIDKLQGSAKAFFEHEFNGKEFAATKRQVLRRLYGILENQTFERMFSHPKSKLDLFAEMNAGKVILINTAKDLLKESGTEIFGRFFIAMITQAAQERAVLAPGDRLPTFVYIDEANDYFDRNIGIILSQARKYKVGMTLAHQYLGQLDPKLHEAIAANTAIKFAGGVSAKDARALAGELRTEASFIEGQPRLSFAAMIKGQHERAVPVAITPGRMEVRDRMNDDERAAVRDIMRQTYAVHYSELFPTTAPSPNGEDPSPTKTDDNEDTGEPMKW